MKDPLIQGYPEIQRDAVIFRHGAQTFELPTYGVVGTIAHYNGICYEARLSKVKAAARRRTRERRP